MSNNKIEERLIDLRSDTMTLPSPEMKSAMCAAKLGDDVWGEDPTVLSFQEEVADLLGKESAIFLPTATQANLCAIMSHCQRGEEYIVGNEAHCYRWEAGGAAVLGSVQPQPIPFEADGSLDLTKVANNIKPDDPHFAVTKLLCLENTQSGKPLPIKYLVEANNFCKKHKLGLHMDGARAFNAAVSLGISICKLVEEVDSVTLCLSKGLGCPTGALLVGARALIKRAYRWRKMLGGALRQSGMLAAAGQYALKHLIDALKDDHLNAERLASGIKEFKDPRLQVLSVATNMLFINVDDSLVGNIQSYAEKHGILLPSGKKMRLVTHRDVDHNGVKKVLSVLGDCLSLNFQNSDKRHTKNVY